MWQSLVMSELYPGKMHLLHGLLIPLQQFYPPLGGISSARSLILANVWLWQYQHQVAPYIPLLRLLQFAQLQADGGVGTEPAAEEGALEG